MSNLVSVKFFCLWCEFFIYCCQYTGTFIPSICIYGVFFCIGGGPSPSDVSDVSQKVCDILGEDSSTLAGIEGGIDVDEEEDIVQDEVPTLWKRPRYVKKIKEYISVHITSKVDIPFSSIIKCFVFIFAYFTSYIRRLSRM